MTLTEAIREHLDRNPKPTEPVIRTTDMKPQEFTELLASGHFVIVNRSLLEKVLERLEA